MKETFSDYYQNNIGRKYSFTAPIKHQRGDSPCFNCGSGRHKVCRPKRDGALCTCACPPNKAFIAQYAAAREMADNLGAVAPTPIEFYLELNPDPRSRNYYR